MILSKTKILQSHLYGDSEQGQEEVTWWIVAVTQSTLPGSITVLIRVRVWLDQLQPSGSTAMDQSDLAPAHTNRSSSQQVNSLMHVNINAQMLHTSNWLFYATWQQKL